MFRVRKNKILAVGAFLLAALLLFVYYAPLSAVFAFNGPPSGGGIGSGAIGVGAGNAISVGTSTPIAGTMLTVIGSSSDLNYYALKILNASQGPLFYIRNDGSMAMATSTLTANTLTVGGNLTVGGALTASNLGASTINAMNVSAGTFASTTGGGNFSFSGNVGIGTTTPAGELTVNGVNTGVPTLYVQGITGQTADYVDFYDGNGTRMLNINNSDDLGYFATTDYGARFNINTAGTAKVAMILRGASGQTADLMQVQNSGGTVMFNTTAGGYVGIATSSPAYPLDVYGTARATNIIDTGVLSQNCVGTNSSGQLQAGTCGGSVSLTAGNGSLTASPSTITGTGSFVLNVGNANTWSAAQTFSAATNFPGSGVWNTSGQVGIGVSPSYKLDVNGQVAIEQKNFGGNAGLYIIGNSPASSWPNIGFGLTNTSAATVQGVMIAGQITNNTAGSEAMDLFFDTMTADILSERMRILANGNVGIGVTGPSYKLDVVSGGATTARFGTASGDTVVIGGGAGKITVGTVDPAYTINGEKFATYGADMTGVKGETTGNVDMKCDAADGTGRCSAVLDFGNAAKGSDLWLFAETTNLKANFGQLTVLLTPSFDGRAWYEKDAANDRLMIYGIPSDYRLPATGYQVSYRLTAPRFDAGHWGNVGADDAPAGIIIND
jgi:hypothetical protein